MERPLKRQQRTIGAIVKIPLENGYHTYGRILKSSVAFYDARTKEDMPAEEIVQKKVLFRTGVFHSVITKGYWEKVGKPIPLEPDLLKSQVWYTEDILADKVLIHKDGKQFPANREDVKDIECLAAWDWAAIEQRLNDHYAGRINEEVELMRMGRIISGKMQNSKTN